MIEFRASDLDKRDKIIKAALQEFSNNDFKKASTNNIVKAAGVSKGLLYHYFKSKEELYDYLLEFCFDTVANKLKNDMDWSISDFMLRLKEATRVKMELTFIYPGIYEFAVKALSQLKPEEIQKLYEKHSLGLLAKVYYENIDFSLFKDGIDIERVTQVIQWTFEKYGASVRDSGKVDINQIMKDVDEYIDLFKIGFYK